MLNFFEKKWESKNCRLYVCFKTLKEPPGFMEEPYGFVDGYLTSFTPPKNKLRMVVRAMAALCTVSSEQATLYNCGCA
jgi:hypothetical protein